MAHRWGERARSLRMGLSRTRLQANIDDDWQHAHFGHARVYLENYCYLSPKREDGRLASPPSLYHLREAQAKIYTLLCRIPSLRLGYFFFTRLYLQSEARPWATSTPARSNFECGYFISLDFL